MVVRHLLWVLGANVGLLQEQQVPSETSLQQKVTRKYCVRKRVGNGFPGYSVGCFVCFVIGFMYLHFVLFLDTRT